MNPSRTTFANCRANGREPLNSYALVAYVSAPLGSFLDGLRLELAPGGAPRAHVTILPPRPLVVDPKSAWGLISKGIGQTPAFEIAATDVEVFLPSSVIYLAIGKGWRELQNLHGVLNSGALAFAEPFPYHPHLTLAQDILPGQVQGLRDLAVRRWAEFRGPRAFQVETITFVQNTEGNQWIDLAECSLTEPAAVAVSRKGRSAL